MNASYMKTKGKMVPYLCSVLWDGQSTEMSINKYKKCFTCYYICRHHWRHLGLLIKDLRTFKDMELEEEI